MLSLQLPSKQWKPLVSSGTTLSPPLTTTTTTAAMETAAEVNLLLLQTTSVVPDLSRIKFVFPLVVFQLVACVKLCMNREE